MAASFPDAEDRLYVLRNRITDLPKRERGTFFAEYEELQRRVYFLRENRGRLTPEGDGYAELDPIVNAINGLIRDLKSGGAGALAAENLLDRMARYMENSYGFWLLGRERAAQYRRKYEQLRSDLRAGRVGAQAAIDLHEQMVDEMRSLAGAAAFAPKDSKLARWSRGVEKTTNPVYVAFREARVRRKAME